MARLPAHLQALYDAPEEAAWREARLREAIAANPSNTKALMAAIVGLNDESEERVRAAFAESEKLQAAKAEKLNKALSAFSAFIKQEFVARVASRASQGYVALGPEVQSVTIRWNKEVKEGELVLADPIVLVNPVSKKTPREPGATRRAGTRGQVQVLDCAEQHNHPAEFPTMRAVVAALMPDKSTKPYNGAMYRSWLKSAGHRLKVA